jgi:phage nucleotide-binding protein
MRYIDEFEVIPSYENADNALFLGTALHTGIEIDADTAIRQYMMTYPVITDDHITEAIKLEIAIKEVRRVLPSGEYEVEIGDDDFIGYIDLLAPATAFHDSVIPDVYDIYDFKYSNNISNYLDSRQLHLYKHYFEKTHPGKSIRNMFFVFVPKCKLKRKKDETLFEFRKRVKEDLSDINVNIIKIPYDESKVTEFFKYIKTITETTKYPQNPSWLCRYCELNDYCQKGYDYMILPKNERRNLEQVEKRTLWIYGVPFCGKTTFANAFPDPLMLNTDGNIKFVDAPYIRIKDEINMEGRLKKTTKAWEVFKDIINELEKKQNDFKTIVVDLLEDLYEYCRIYVCTDMGISHESDDSFKAWDKVRTEFLNTLKRLMALDYENIILISHEDTTNDLTKKGGDKITKIKPNLPDKVALKVAGMVDVVARIVADDTTRTFCFKSNEVIFGGGRLKADAKDIPLDVAALFKVYDEANSNAVRKHTETAPDSVSEDKQVNTPPTEEVASDATVSGRKSRSRRTADSEPTEAEQPAETPVADEADAPKEEPKAEPTQEAPKTRTRKKRVSNFENFNVSF